MIRIQRLYILGKSDVNMEKVENHDKFIQKLNDSIFRDILEYR